ncbi:MAG: hypothetical protein KKD18_00795, partial [Nanoarchaeota archaeon]|nr:hypothetical protein [Nanoarchaeota archaeon]
MKKRTILLATFIAICLIVSVSALLIVNANTNNSPPINGQITCHALKENPGGINIVFLASEEDAKKYSDYLLTIVPFSEYRDKLNFYYIPPTEYKADCSLYQNIAVLCNSKENIKAASVCPNDIRVILVSKPASIRSSALKGTLSLNTEHPLQVFAHEIGHGIAYFAEEYLSPGSTLPKGAGNCLKNCEEIQNLPNSKNYGCYPECTTSDYNREFPEGIMRTLHAERYGNLDENLLREKIEKASQKTTVTGLAIGDEKPCSEQQFYLIEGSSVELVQGCPPGEDFQYG